MTAARRPIVAFPFITNLECVLVVGPVARVAANIIATFERLYCTRLRNEASCLTVLSSVIQVSRRSRHADCHRRFDILAFDIDTLVVFERGYLVVDMAGRIAAGKCDVGTRDTAHLDRIDIIDSDWDVFSNELHLIPSELSVGVTFKCREVGRQITYVALPEQSVFFQVFTVPAGARLLLRPP